MITFGERLRQLRRAAGLSQTDLAGEELSASYISLLEAGKRSPSDEVVKLLCLRLKCSGSQLLDGRPSDRDQRLELEMAYAKLAIEHGESRDARARLENLLAEEYVPPLVRDEAALLLGTALERLNEYEAAVRVLQPLFDRSRNHASRVSLMQVSMVLCRCYIDSGDLHWAATVGEQALEAGREHGLDSTNDFFRLAATVMGAYIDLGDLLHARNWAQPLIEQASASGQVSGQAALYWNSALVAELEGNLDIALSMSRRALATLSELDNLRDFAKVRLAMAGILLSVDPPDITEAERLLDGSLSDLTDLGSRFDLGEWNQAKSAVLLERGDAVGAEGRARQALDLLRNSSPWEPALAWLRLHDALLAQDRLDEASGCLHDARGELERAGGGRASALLWRELGERMTATGDTTAGAEAYRRALDCANVRDRSRAARTTAAALRTASQLSGSPAH